MESITRGLRFQGELFAIEGQTAFVILPESSPAGDAMRWVWYAPTLLPKFPDELEEWMFRKFLARGIAVAGIDVGESYGSPAGRSSFNVFYEELVTERGFSDRPCLLARSRGGLMHYNWAAENSMQVACIAGIYPVCDLRSYPGLDRACDAYGLTEEQLAAQLPQHNPVDRLDPLARAGVPIFHVHGDVDTSVPLESNSGEVATRYRAAGGDIHVEIIKDQGHTGWMGFFQCRELVDFVLDHAK